MYSGVNDSLFLGLQTGLLSDYSVIDTATDASSESGQLFSRGPLLGGEGWNINHWLLDIPLNTCNPQVDEEVGSINLRGLIPCTVRLTHQHQSYRAYLHSPIHQSLFRRIDEQVGAQTPQADDFINSIYGWYTPLIHAFDTMYLTTSLPWFTEV